jgi:hypothetical protein
MVLILLGVAGSYLYVYTTRPSLDPETACPINGPSAVTVVLFDRTDPFNERQQIFLENQLAELRDSAKQFEQISTYDLLDQGAQVIKPILTVCNPGRGENANPLYDSQLLREERWRKQFEAPLREKMDTFRHGGDAKTSPILEAVQSVSLQSFQQPRLEATPKKLVLISDLLQYTKTLDFYKFVPPYNIFRSGADGVRLRTNLSDAAVLILFIRRGKLDAAPLFQFWTNWFVDQGANPDHFKIKPVEG